MDLEPHIVVVEDEVTQRDLLVGYLSRQGYRVAGAESGNALRLLVESEVPALVTLDVGLPGEDGFALARWLRGRSSRVGIIMVTAATDTVDRVVGFEIGADDYIAKPFEPLELLARVKSVLRRGARDPDPEPAPGNARRLAAILAADIVGYSRLMGFDEEGTFDRLRVLRREVIDPEVATHHGRIVKTTGDGILMEFPSAVDAVRCAIGMQRGVAAGNGATSPHPIEYRIGINIGDIIEDGDDILGDSVNIAARLEGIAEPGGICLSASAYDQVYGKIDAGYVDLGEQSLKNIARPLRAYRLVV